MKGGERGADTVRVGQVEQVAPIRVLYVTVK